MIASSIASIFIATLVLSTSAAGAPIDRRSEYPPDYILTTDCKRDGPVEVCSLNRNTASSRLVIRYHKSGYLWPQASPLSAYVNFNGIQATFGNFTADTSIANAPVSAEYVIGAYRDLHWCYHATTATTPRSSLSLVRVWSLSRHRKISPSCPVVWVKVDRILLLPGACRW
ncbi:hypothetical protein BC829DRAFT_429095 [Chytridium lagenaria]|nr:hypothetical protein BC829DRAFT_429095 [Chytridium lagenaria]